MCLHLNTESWAVSTSKYRVIGYVSTSKYRVMGYVTSKYGVMGICDPMPRVDSMPRTDSMSRTDRKNES